MQYSYKQINTVTDLSYYITQHATKCDKGPKATNISHNYNGRTYSNR